MPLLPSVALKNSVPFTFVREFGFELPPPGLMSATRVVVVPSLFHSSRPLLPSFALKNSVPFTFVKFPGCEPPPPG